MNKLERFQKPANQDLWNKNSLFEKSLCNIDVPLDTIFCINAKCKLYVVLGS